MKRWLGLLTMTFTVGSLFVTLAAHADDHTLDGVDISAAVKYFKPYVQPIKRSFTIYNWAQSSDLTAGADRAMRTAYKRSETFWNEYGKANSSMYGAGLYGAADPIFTLSYGGGISEGKWVLFEMELPVGFRLVDLEAPNVTKDASLRSEVFNLQINFDCPMIDGIDWVFSSGGTALSAKCRTFTKRLFKDILKVDGIAYNYGATSFQGCKNDYFHESRAFVITSGDWVQADNVHLYTAKSTDDKERRIRIQSLFFRDKDGQQTSAPLMTPSAIAILSDYFAANPTKNLKGSTSTCANDLCDFSAILCDDQNKCDTVKLTRYNRKGGGVISAEDAAALNIPILWNDLLGESRSPDQVTWLKNNKFGCSGTYPYEDLPAVVNGSSSL